MPAFIRSGGAWSETIPRKRSGGVWTSEEDSLWAHDAGIWKLIYEPADDGVLFAVENLAVSDITHNSATASWTLPNQTTEPTDVSINYPDQADVWTEYPYPLTSVPIAALGADKEYQIRVKLIQRVNGEIAAQSPERTVFFRTLVAPVGAPAPDPGGTGGDTLLPIYIAPPGGGWTPPSTSNGCWLEWELFIVELATLSWITTGLTGTHDGTIADFPYDFATLDPTRTYRFCFRTACDTNADTIADSFGTWECSESFVGLADWGALCGSVPESDLAGDSAAADAVYGFPQVCLADGGQRVALFDRVSGVEIGRGADFQFVYNNGTEWLVVADSDGGVTMLAPIAALTTLMVPAQDASFLVRYQFNDAHVTSLRSYVIAAIGGMMLSFWISETVTGWSVVCRMLGANGMIEVSSAEMPLDTETHSFILRWDADGDKDLFVDGVLVDSDTSGVDWA